MKPGKFENVVDSQSDRYGVICRCHPLNPVIFASEPEEDEPICCSRCDGSAVLCGKHDSHGHGCTLLAGHEQDGFTCVSSKGILLYKPKAITLQVPAALASELRRMIVGHAATCYQKAHDDPPGHLINELNGDAWMELARTIKR